MDISHGLDHRGRVAPVRTLVVGEHPEMEALLDERTARGLDLWDEVWEGVYVMVPFAHSRHGVVKSDLVYAVEGQARRAGLQGGDSFNLGEPEDYRVPDAGWHHGPTSRLYVPTAAIVLEVRSPDDDTFAKFGFYAAHGVDELLVAEPLARTVRCWHLLDGGYVEADRSVLLDLAMADLVAEVRWPD